MNFLFFPCRRITPRVMPAWLLLCVLGSPMACSPVQKPTESAEKFTVTQPVVMDTLYTREYVADIQARQHIEIRARVAGFLDHIHVDEGAFVRKGQRLFSISSQEYQQELLKAKANLKNAVAEAKAAQVELQNVSQLVEKKVVATSELARAKAHLEALQARVKEATTAQSGANLRLAMTDIKSPFDGVVDRIPNKVGSLIDEGMLLTTLSDNREVVAYFNVPESEYLDFVTTKEAHQGEAIGLILANNQRHAHPGTLEKIDGQIDKSTGSLAFRARFANPNQLLKHGSSGKVRLDKALRNALIIPQKATFEVQDKLFVFVVDAGNTVHLRSIVTKLRLPHVYILESGLTPSDRILYEGIQHVTDGDRIDPQSVPLPQLVSQLTQN